MSNLVNLKYSINKAYNKLIECDYKQFLYRYSNFRLDDFKLESELDKYIKEKELKVLYIQYLIELIKEKING